MSIRLWIVSSYVCCNSAMVCHVFNTVGKFCALAVVCFALTLQQSAFAIYGVAVADNGTIRQTPDGGNWFPRSSGTTKVLRAVSCVSKSCWIVGDDGIILHSDDAGVTWTGQESGTTQTLNGVDFATRNHGLAVGNLGTILATTDGGITWNSQEATETYDLKDVVFVDANNGWISGNGPVRHTIDGGMNWSFQSSSGYKLDFTSATDGWQGGNGWVAKTTDGGVDWSRLYPDPIQGSLDLSAIDFVTADQGVVAGLQGLMYFTDNGGTTWDKIQTPLFRDVFIDDATGIGWAVGEGMWKTTNGGRNWSPQMSGTTNVLFGVTAFDVFPDGDYNRDRIVNDADYSIWRSSFGSTSNLAADGNGDGRVDAADYVVWRKNGGQGLSTIAVPEPTSITLFTASLVLCVKPRRRVPTL